MEYKVFQAALDEIRLDDSTFRISTAQDKPSLQDSIQKFGLLQPPAVWYGPDGLTVVSGFRRILACRELGYQTIPARRLADDLRPLDCLRMALTENITQRPLNIVETARAVRRVMRHCPPGLKPTDELALFGLPTSRAMINRLDRLRRLPADLQDAVVAGTIGLNTGLEIGRLEQRDQIALFTLFTRLGLSVSKQKEMLTMTREIAGRDKKNIADVIQSKALGAIADDDQLDRNQKTALIRRHLKTARYPHLSAYEARYHQAVRALKLGTQMRIDPPPYFEGTAFTLSLRFASRRDLEAAHCKIGTILQNTAIDTIFQP